MFTGLITHIGVIAAIQGDSIIIRCKINPVLGESISIDGICLTVISPTEDSFTVEVSPETKAVTTVKYWQVGTHVNLEKSLKIGDRLGGHFVMGHVDGTARVKNIISHGEFTKIDLTDLPKGAEKYIVKKGSVSINGVSLTVNTYGSVTLIPHTLEQTNLKNLTIGQQVNIEYDYLARYIRGEADVCER